MSPRTTSFLAYLGFVGIAIGVLIVLTQTTWVGVGTPVNENQEIIEQTNGTGTSTAASQSASAASSAVSPATSTHPKPIPNVKTAPVKQTKPQEVVPAQSEPVPTSRLQAIEDNRMQDPSAQTSPDTSGFQVARIENPYPFPPKTFEAVNTEARLAIVNILCAARSGSLRPISASAVLIDPRGVILTNAHVAQYVLLASDPQIDLSCVIRTGSPAVARFTPEILYIPPVWVEEHASDIKTARPTGTGAHDYALLRIKSTLNGSPVLDPPAGGFPYLPLDAREGIGFPGDSVLVASYPAEFLGGMTAQLGLYSVTSITTIKSLLTLGESGTVDVVSLGGIIGAQSGSSGGAVVNAWGRLIGLISTTSEGETTADRDLHAITLSYINGDITAQSGRNLAGIVAGDVAQEALAFNTNQAPALIKLLIDQLKSR